MKLCKLNKIVLSVTNNAVKFLNGLTSNTIDSAKNAFVNVQGRIIATFDQIKIDDDKVFIVLESSFQGVLREHLDKFARLAGAQIKREDFNVYYDLGGDYRPQDGELAVPQKQGQIVITQENLDAPVGDNEFTLYRLKNNIPLQGVDYHQEFLLNVDEEQYVSFAKGCFLGQEPIAKVHNRSKPTWKLAVRFEDDCGEELKAKMTSKAKDPETNRVVGFVFLRNQQG